MERYWVANGILASNECGGLVKYDDAQRALDAERARVKELEAELEEYRSIAEQQGASKAVSQLATLQAQVKQLDRTLADVYQQRDGLQAQLRQVEGQSQQQAEEAVIVFAKYTTLRQLVEVHTKQLTELTIIPIGCSREQELRWTQSIKDLRATLAAQDAGKESHE